MSMISKLASKASAGLQAMPKAVMRRVPDLESTPTTSQRFWVGA